jgi:hypothetical protein
MRITSYRCAYRLGRNLLAIVHVMYIRRTRRMSCAAQSLARLVLLGTLRAGSEVNTIASEAASTSGACMYAAGLHSLPMRPTSAAREALIPALCRAFVGELLTFDFRREVVWAIWSALSFDPLEMDDIVYDLRTGSLVDIVRSAPRDMANALTTMLATSDADAMEVSLSLIELEMGEQWEAEGRILGEDWRLDAAPIFSLGGV